jgi:hypothetical protein
MGCSVQQWEESLFEYTTKPKYIFPFPISILVGLLELETRYR